MSGDRLPVRLGPVVGESLSSLPGCVGLRATRYRAAVRPVGTQMADHQRHAGARRSAGAGGRWQHLRAMGSGAGTARARHRHGLPDLAGYYRRRGASGLVGPRRGASTGSGAMAALPSALCWPVWSPTSGGSRSQYGRSRRSPPRQGSSWPPEWTRRTSAEATDPANPGDIAVRSADVNLMLS